MNLVVLTLRVQPPWGGCPLGLPVNVRVHHKGGSSAVALAIEMIAEVAGWLPERSFHLHADGAYANLVGADQPGTVVTSRMRRDAVLHEPSPPRTGKRGRPRTKGERLPTPPQLAEAATGWVDADVDERGHTVSRRLWSRDVLWYHGCPHRMVHLVVVRDPAGTQPDDFFVTSQPPATDTEVASGYAGRWSIEVTNRDAKHDPRGEDPQSWKGDGPARAAVSLWLHTAIWC